MDKQKKISKSGNNHLVLIPCPLQGHMNPMLNLAKLLHSKGLNITIILISTQNNHKLNPKPIFLESFPEFNFQSIDGTCDFPFGVGEDVMFYLSLLNDRCKEPFRDCLLNKLMPNFEVSCIVYDAVMYFSVAISDEFEIPRIVLRTSSASNFLALSSLDQKQKCFVMAKDEDLRAKDMPNFNTSNNETLAKIHIGTTAASAVIWNSLHCLESPAFEKLKDKIPSPIFPICPTLFHNQTISFPSLYSEDHHCISWLDSQAPKSVLYVSTGSLVSVTENELFEMACGLANSGQPFLWVVRPDLVLKKATTPSMSMSTSSEGHENNVFPQLGFFQEVIAIGRGKVVEWAPQRRVLGHRSLGGFLTHNGWNSTMESVSEGVPMICWPRIGDQRVNARVVSYVWKVGIELEGESLGRWEVERAIKRLMVSEEGFEIRERAMELKKKMRDSLAINGYSSQLVDELVHFLSNLSHEKI